MKCPRCLKIDIDKDNYESIKDETIRICFACSFEEVLILQGCMTYKFVDDAKERDKRIKATNPAYLSLMENRDFL